MSFEYANKKHTLNEGSDQPRPQTPASFYRALTVELKIYFTADTEWSSLCIYVNLSCVSSFMFTIDATNRIQKYTRLSHEFGDLFFDRLSSRSILSSPEPKAHKVNL